MVLFPSLSSPGPEFLRPKDWVSLTHRLIHRPEEHSPSRTSCVTSRLDSAVRPTSRGRPSHSPAYRPPPQVAAHCPSGSRFPSLESGQVSDCSFRDEAGMRLLAFRGHCLRLRFVPWNTSAQTPEATSGGWGPYPGTRLGVKELPEDSSSSHQVTSGHWNPPSSDLRRGKQRSTIFTVRVSIPTQNPGASYRSCYLKP